MYDISTFTKIMLAGDGLTRTASLSGIDGVVQALNPDSSLTAINAGSGVVRVIGAVR